VDDRSSRTAAFASLLLVVSLAAGSRPAVGATTAVEGVAPIVAWAVFDFGETDKLRSKVAQLKRREAEAQAQAARANTAARREHVALERERLAFQRVHAMMEAYRGRADAQAQANRALAARREHDASEWQRTGIQRERAIVEAKRARAEAQAQANRADAAARREHDAFERERTALRRERAMMETYRRQASAQRDRLGRLAALAARPCPIAHAPTKPQRPSRVALSVPAHKPRATKPLSVGWGAI
jgi:hypothetical protein